jgi:iron complex transport system substrate-binding protein
MKLRVKWVFLERKMFKARNRKAGRPLRSRKRGSGSRVLLAILGLALGAGSLAAQTTSGAGVRDDQGFLFRPGPPPQRIVSLAPSITEVLFDLGLGPRIVGDTRYCDTPPEALAKPKIGGLLDPDLEKIRALNPDLIIAFRGNPLPVIQRMRGLGLPVFVLEEGETIESLFGFLAKIGRVTQRPEKAERLIRALRARYDRVQERLGRSPRRPRVFLAIHGLGFWTSGRDSYLTDLVARAGGLSVSADIGKRWVEFSHERLLEAAPEVFVLLVRSGRDFEAAKRWLLAQASLRSLPAVKEGRVFALDENEASRFGPRIVDVLERLAKILHPEMVNSRQSSVISPIRSPSPAISLGSPVSLDRDPAVLWLRTVG